MLDPRNTPVSCQDSDALSIYEAALKSYQIYVGDPVEQIEQALVVAPDFILGHVFRSFAYQMSTERAHLVHAAESIEAVEKLLHKANAREKGLLAASTALLKGKWNEARQLLDAVMREYPHDIFALQTAHLLDFLCGDAMNLRNRPARVLPEWSESMPGYSYILGMHAFGLEECNQYSMAEDNARAALALDPNDAWSVHAAVHVMEMQGRTQDGIEFLEQREVNWAPDNGFAFHNWWHLSLLYLEQYKDHKVLEIYDLEIDLDANESMVMLDASALIWRLHLIGVDVTERAQRLAAKWAYKAGPEAGHYPFNDFHAALAFATCGELARIEALLHAMKASLSDSMPSNTAMTSRVGIPLVEAVLSFANGDYADTVDTLNNVRDYANEFGGSHAQRNILELTLLSAAKRSGKLSHLRHISNERFAQKPDAVLLRRVIEAA